MKNRLLFIAYILEGLSRKSVLFWDRGPMHELMGRPQTRFEMQKI